MARIRWAACSSTSESFDGEVKLASSTMGWHRESMDFTALSAFVEKTQSIARDDSLEYGYLQTTASTADGFVAYTINAGTATSQGFEAAVDYQPQDTLRFGVVDARLEFLKGRYQWSPFAKNLLDQRGFASAGLGINPGTHGLIFFGALLWPRMLGISVNLSL